MVVLGFGYIQAAPDETADEWAFNVSLIEACSCPVFCQCYFNTEPAAHGGHNGGTHFCQFNVAYNVNERHHGDVDLKGAKFWVAGDLGDSFADMEGGWAVLHFDPSVNLAQREAIGVIVGHIYPLKWKSFAIGEDGPVLWEKSKNEARASLDGGKTAEIRLKASDGMGGRPAVLQNVRYSPTVQRHDGLVVMPNEIEVYRAGDKPFAFKGTTGFTTTLDITSKDIQ